LADWPAEIVFEAGEVPTVKLVTTIWMFCEDEKVGWLVSARLLLAATATLLVPNGQFILVLPAVLVPHPPVKLRSASTQVMGSEKPKSGAARLTPVGVLPPTTRVEDPPKTGTVARVEISAFARPEPNSVAGKSGSAPSKSRSFSSDLAVTLSNDWDPGTFVSKHTLLSSNRAAIPAMCGVAAEVPKNVLPKPPEPVIETPSIPEISGLLRPSRVGP
jgi:hypothetical protein